MHFSTMEPISVRPFIGSIYIYTEWAIWILSQRPNREAVMTSLKIIPMSLQYITHPSASLLRAQNRAAV